MLQNGGFPGIRRGKTLLGGLSRANTGQPVGMFRQQIRLRNLSACDFFNGVVPTFFAGILCPLLYCPVVKDKGLFKLASQ